MSSHHRQSSQTYVYQITKKHDDLKYQQYTIGKLLGEGGFAQCYKTRRRSDGRAFAIKAIKLNEKKEHHSKDKHKSSRHHRTSTEQKAYSEAKLLKMCQHHNIVKYETDFIYDNAFYIVMEYCDYGSFGDMLKQRKCITETQARYYINQMVHGLQYLKSRKIIHRDLKPANYLLTQTLQLKIADFGLATQVRNNSPYHKNICGTPNYISPEMLDRKDYSYEVDLWSIGVILYSMLYGIPPFETQKKDAKQTYDRIKKCQYQLSNPKISDQAKDLISKILVLDPHKRIPLDCILGHPFMSKFQIPRELSHKFIKQVPDDRFLSMHGQNSNKKKQKSKGRSQSAKVKEPFRYSPSQQQFPKNSFSNSRQYKFQDFTSLKKQIKKIKFQTKESQKSQKKRPKSMVEAMKKFQKEDMVTSSPVSSQSSANGRNKYIQYPSEEQRLNLQLNQINQVLHSKGQKIEQETVKEIHNEAVQYSNNSKPFVPSPFPSFAHLMKKLSFENLSHNPNYIKSINASHKDFVQSIMKNPILSELPKVTKSKNITAKAEAKGQPFLSTSEEAIYSLEDFMTFNSSLHLSSQKMIKMVYCLKQQNLTKNQKPSSFSKNSKNLAKNQIKFIGSIFFDNSSIVTKIYSINNQVRYSSIYIKNVQITEINPKQDFSNPIQGLTRKSNEKRTKSETWFVIDADMFDKQIPFKRNTDYNHFTQQKLDFDMKLKIKFARDGIKFFKSILSKSFPWLLSQKKSLKPLANQKQTIKQHLYIQTDSDQIEDFKFVKMFRTRKESTLYFEMNDGSKHYMQKRPQDKSYLDLFKNKTQTKIKSYHLLIYFPQRGIAFVRKSNQEQLKQIGNTEFKNLRKNGDLEIQEKQNNVKDCQDDSQEENCYQNCSKKIKLNENHSQSMREQKSYKLSNKPLTSPAIPSSSELLSKICLEFRQKLELFYIRQRDGLSLKQNKNLHAVERNKLQKQKQYHANESCRIEIENGKFEYKMDGKSYQKNVLASREQGEILS